MLFRSLRFFNSEAKLHFEYRNDARNLYFILLSSEKSTMIQIMKAGCSVNIKAKKSLSTNATITIPPQRFESIQLNQVKTDGLPDKLVEKTASKPLIFKDTIILEGFQFSEGVITDDNKVENRVSFAKNKDKRSQYSCEFCVPLCELFGNNYDLAKVSLIPFQFQIILNELTLSNEERSRHRGANRSENIMSNSGEMHSGGIRGGGMNDGGMRGSQELGDRVKSQHLDKPFETSMSKKKIVNIFYFTAEK